MEAHDGVEPWVGSQAVEDAVGRKEGVKKAATASKQNNTKSNSEAMKQEG